MKLSAVTQVKNQADTGLKGDVYMCAGGVAVSLCCNRNLFIDGLISPNENFVTGLKTSNYATCG